MNKKIIPLVFLLIVLISVTVTYAYFHQQSTHELPSDDSSKTIQNNDISNEIDKTFIDENEQVEIGDMI